MRSTFKPSGGSCGSWAFFMRRGRAAAAWLAVLCAAWGCVWLAGCSAKDAEDGSGAAPAREPVVRAPAVEMVSGQGAHDFGEMTPLSKLDVVFLIENPGTEPLVIKTIKRECDCTEIVDSGLDEIPPGGSSPVTVRFEAPKDLGRYVTRVVVLTEDATKPIIPLVIRATIVAPED